MECPYPDCKFVAAPGQAAEDGVCPGCDRPYKSQPTPSVSDMAERNMPAPGEEDMGGNPLQEGILGDYQNRGVRDESYASVKTSGPLCPRCHGDLTTNSRGSQECTNCFWDGEFNTGEPIDFETTEVVPPDPESLRPSKKRMDKQADLLNSIEDVAAPVVGGTAGFLVGGPLGAAAGAGLAGGAMDAAQGEGAGHAIGTGVEDAALGGGAGLGAGALGLGAAGDAAAGAGAASVSSGSAADAAAAGGTRGGIGSLMKSAWSKVPTTQLRNAYLMHSALNDASGAMQGQMAPPSGMAPTQSVEPPSYYSHTAAENDTPSSHNHVPSNDTDDPEEVDFNERNDGDNESKGLEGDQGVNDMGGTDLGPDDFFSPDSEALGSLAQLLPKVLDFALSDKTPEGDPDMEGLHQKLDTEMPGYMDHANDDHGVKLITMIVKGTPGDEGNDDLLQDNDKPHDPITDSIQASVQAHVESALRPGLDTACPRCGGVIDPSTHACPQCGMSNMGHQPQPTNPDFTTPQQMMNPPVQSKTAGEGPPGQGPNSDEQKAAVAQLLQEEGREEEIPNMILNPQEYADELTQISGQEEPPEDIGQPGPPPPVVPAEQQGEMPVPGMSTPAPAGATMASAIAKYAGTVDVAAEPCPKCNSHSTGYTDPEEGQAGCKACGHHWKTKPLVEVTSAEHHDDDANPLGVPQAEAEGPPDVEKEVDSSHSWVDTDGEPLHVNQDYEMYSANYEIPDRIRIDAVKPDVIQYTMIGEYGLGHRTELTHEESNIENTSFIPANHEEFNQGEPGPEGLEQNQDDIARPGPGEETDASTPHMMASKQANPESINLEPNWEGMRAWILNMARTDLANAVNINDTLGSEAVPAEQLAQAAGVSPEEVTGLGGGALDDLRELPVTEHPTMGHEGKTADFDDLNDPTAPCPNCGGEGIDRTGGTCFDCQGSGYQGGGNFQLRPSPHQELEHQFNIPTVEHPLGEHTGAETGPDWMIKEGFVSTAGAPMTPWEQRDYIEEDGVARNADKLNLDGTHYEHDPIEDSFIFGL